jgi:hypothetical protein
MLSKRKRGVGLYDDSDSDTGYDPLPKGLAAPPPKVAYSPLIARGQPQGQLVSETAVLCVLTTHIVSTALADSSKRIDLTARNNTPLHAFNLPAPGWGMPHIADGVEGLSGHAHIV